MTSPIQNPFGLVRIVQNNARTQVELEFETDAGSTAFFHCWNQENFLRTLNGRVVHCSEGALGRGEVPPLKMNQMIQLLNHAIGPVLWSQLSGKL